MSRFRLNKLPKEKRAQMIGEFYDIVDCLKDRREVRLFFKDLLTPDEIANLMRRIEVAVLLIAGFTYEQIAEILGVGKGKVANVQKVLSKGGEGYKFVIKRLLDKRKKKLKMRERVQKLKESDFEKLKRRYPLHFLLFNLVDEIADSLDRVKGKEREKRAIIDTPSATYKYRTIE